MTQVIDSALSDNTKQLYRRAWTLLQIFGKQFNLQTFPANSHTIGLWITDLHCKGYATNTIRTFVSAIAYYHKLSNFPDPSSTFKIEKTFQGLKKIRPSADQRKPITPAIINQLIAQLRKSDMTTYDKTLFTTMFLVAFYGLCRVSEITHSKANKHNLQLNSVTVQAKQSRIVITFKSFKHSSTPQSVTINQQYPPNICPVQTVQEYIKIRNTSTQTLFVYSSGQPVTRTRFNSVLKQVATLSKLDSKLYTSHSFRIGGATLAARSGMSELTIQRLGRWHSKAFLKYLRW